MIRLRIARFIGVVTLTVVIVLSVGRSALADGSIPLPAGLACSFPLTIDFRGEFQEPREFKDKSGNVVRTLAAGRGVALTFMNEETGATLSLQANGSVAHETRNADGSSIWIITGHNVLILFPTDVPAGPSTTLYVGRVVYTVDSAGVFTLQQISGQSTDICTALS